MSKAASSDRMAWFKFDPGAFMVETEGVTPLESGIYIQLVCRYWVKGCELPPRDRIERGLGLQSEEERAALGRVLSEYFPEGQHAALDRQLVEAQGRSKQASENGKLGGRRPAGATQQAPKATPAGSPSTAPVGDNPEDF